MKPQNLFGDVNRYVRYQQVETGYFCRNVYLYCNSQCHDDLFWYAKDNDVDRQFKEQWMKSNYAFILSVSFVQIL